MNNRKKDWNTEQNIYCLKCFHTLWPNERLNKVHLDCKVSLSDGSNRKLSSNWEKLISKGKKSKEVKKFKRKREVMVSEADAGLRPPLS